MRNLTILSAWAVNLFMASVSNSSMFLRRSHIMIVLSKVPKKYYEFTHWNPQKIPAYWLSPVAMKLRSNVNAQQVNMDSLESKICKHVPESYKQIIRWEFSHPLTSYSWTIEEGGHLCNFRDDSVSLIDGGGGRDILNGEFLYTYWQQRFIRFTL